MRGDGDGWLTTHTGQQLWGRHGAAGLLLRAPTVNNTTAVLLQRRAPWVHHGGTWALPGGASDSHETPQQAALRETHEETGIPTDQVTVRASIVTAAASCVGGTRWTYTTVIADAATLLPTTPNRESTGLSWIPEHQITELPLHPAFAAAWPLLRDTAAALPLPVN